MRRPSQLVLVLLATPLACDDTSTALREETREERAEAKRVIENAEAELKAAAKEAKRDVEEAADRVGRAIDHADRALADEIRGEPGERETGD